MKRNLVHASRIIIAVMFIFSGLSKLLSLGFFDTLVAELFFGKDYYNNPEGVFYTQIFSRILITGELVLGFAVLQEKHLKKVVLPAIFAMLVVFTAHLFYTGFTQGFTGENCGCFGDILPMNTLESILKNIVAMGLAVHVWLKYEKEQKYTMSTWVAPAVVGIIAFLSLTHSVKFQKNSEVKEISYASAEQPNSLPAPEVTRETESTEEKEEEEVKEVLPEKLSEDQSPAEKNKTSEEVNQKESEKTEKPAPEEKQRTKKKEKPENNITETVQPEKKEENLITLFKKYSDFSDGSSVEWDKGKKVVAMFSLTCGHCQDAYKELCDLSSEASLPPLYLYNFGEQFDLSYFFSQAGCRHPHVLLEEKSAFDRLLEGQNYPRIVVIEDGKVMKSWNLETYETSKLEKYLGVERKKKNDGELQLSAPPSNSWY